MKKAARSPRTPVTYDLVEPTDVPRRMTAISLQWKALIEQCITTGKRARLTNLGGRTPRGVMSSVNGFVTRYPECIAGYRVRTQQGPTGDVFIWVDQDANHRTEGVQTEDTEQTEAAAG